MSTKPIYINPDCKCLLPEHTFTLAEDIGNVSRNSISRAAGGTKRSPFLTAPFTKIVRAFGVDKILQPKYKMSERDKNLKRENTVNFKTLHTSPQAAKLCPWTVDCNFCYQLKAKDYVPMHTIRQSDPLEKPRQQNFGNWHKKQIYGGKINN